MLPLLIALFIAIPIAAPIAPVPATVPPTSPSLRLETTAFGLSAEIEILGAASESEVLRPALHAAVAEISELEHLADAARADSAVLVLNAAAGKGPQPVAPPLLALLAKAVDFCLWTEGAYGPLGRSVYQAWGQQAVSGETVAPTPEQLLRATSAASCNAISVDTRNARVALAAESGLDLWGFAEGAAIDRAVETLKKRGVASGLVRIGPTWRVFGPGPQGKGWLITLPAFKGTQESEGRLLLRDQALSIADPSERPYVNQRTGQLALGVVATVTVTELAADARPLAISLLITGPREGQLRIGSLRPRPSVLWLVGNGLGMPLRIFYRWTELTRPPR
jgi:thiamine biosynthesis lipoprotein ApbE